MVIDWFYTLHGIKKWINDEEATALVEAAFLLPPMMTLLMGVYDLGNGIAIGQKTISASQIAADLIARDRTMDSAQIENIIDAAELAFNPYALTDFGIDIVSVTFNASQQPVVLWRETRNMSPNLTAVNSVSGLAPQGEGMIIVTVVYDYRPYFSQPVVGEIGFEEVAFTRGRRSPTVTWE